MDPNTNQDPVSPEQPQASNIGSVIKPTSATAGTDGSQLFQPHIHSEREQLLVDSSQLQENGAQVAGQTQNNPSQSMNSTKKPKSKVMIVAIGAVVVLTILTIVAVVLSSGSKQKNTPQTSDASQQEQTGPQPAAALDVEQSNNSINQDMSTLSDADDFPETQLDDKSLGL